MDSVVTSTKVTVSIATRNRADSLRAVLEAMTRLRNPEGFKWEILVVNNACTDHTSQVVAAAQQRLPVREVTEERPGLSHARNRSIQEAAGEIIAFTDDDCLVDPDWLTSIVDAFRVEPDLDGLGGRVELHDPRDQPVTIRTYRQRIPLTSTGQLFALIPGCNMAFRRRVFDSVGLFDWHLGAGAPGASAEDVDMAYRCLRAGLKVVYLPQILVHHAHGRRTDSQVRALHRNYRIGRGAFYCKWILAGEREVARMMMREARDLLLLATRTMTQGNDPATRHLVHGWHLGLGMLIRTPPIGPGPG